MGTHRQSCVPHSLLESRFHCPLATDRCITSPRISSSRSSVRPPVLLWAVLRDYNERSSKNDYAMPKEDCARKKQQQNAADSLLRTASGGRRFALRTDWSVFTFARCSGFRTYESLTRGQFLWQSFDTFKDWNECKKLGWFRNKCEIGKIAVVLFRLPCGDFYKLRIWNLPYTADQDYWYQYKSDPYSPITLWRRFWGIWIPRWKIFRLFWRFEIRPKFWDVRKKWIARSWCLFDRNNHLSCIIDLVACCKITCLWLFSC